MTKEEMADEWVKANCDDSLSSFRGQELQEAFLAGLKAGRPKWHKVADGDLPEAENYFWSRIVLLQTNKGSSIIGFYDHANKAFYEKSTDDVVFGVIAWCEIPKYTEE
jgi:hypothetical protein